MSRGLDWARDGASWPNREASRFVSAAGLRWHVQRMGHGPPLMLLHGTGASTHSWAGLLPLLAERFDVIAPDLPGHGFTAMRASGLLSLPWMADAVAALLDHLGIERAALVGHSAGAAIAARMALDERQAPIVALNGALLPFRGAMQPIASGLAKLLFLNPLVPRLFAWHARHDGHAVRRVIDGTGSRLPPEQLALYTRLFADPGHCDAALAMMANWDLGQLEAELPRLAVPVTLIAADGDKAIPPAVAERVAALVPDARLVRVPGLGHLAHEEAPGRIAPLILTALAGASGSARAPAGSPSAPPPAACDKEA